MWRVVGLCFSPVIVWWSAQGVTPTLTWTQLGLVQASWQHVTIMRYKWWMDGIYAHSSIFLHCITGSMWTSQRYTQSQAFLKLSVKASDCNNPSQVWSAVRCWLLSTSSPPCRGAERGTSCKLFYPSSPITGWGRPGWREHTSAHTTCIQGILSEKDLHLRFNTYCIKIYASIDPKKLMTK